MNYVKKLSSASINAIPKGYKKDMENGETKDLFNIVGIAEGIETGTSQMGEWVAFDGTFQATKLEPNEKGETEVYRSKKLFLPDIAADAIADALNGAEGGKVEFALQIGMRRVVKLNAQGEETGAGYEYTMKPLIEIDEATDPLANLNSKLKALPAPAKAEAKAESKAKAK